jgi:ornithine cyclodeaminase/alanine dehydrogenase-like protein (mu-crystallin family)
MADAASAAVRPGTRVIGMSEMRRLLTLEDTIELQRAAFASQARGQTTAAPNSWLRLPGDRRAWLKILAGHDAASTALGVKVLARFPERGPGANLASLMLLFDDEDGSILAIMDAVYITAVRTAAGAALATEKLARPGARRVGMLGTGTLAWYTVLAHRILCPDLDELVVYSRSAERREAFAARVASQLGIDARAVGTVQDAVAGADVVVTATNAPEPVLLEHQLEPGQHIGAIGIRTEIAPAAIARCRVIGDGRDEALLDGKFSVALAAGAVAADDLGPELGAVLEGLEPGRRGDEEITLFDSSGVAIQDIVCARHAWARATEDDAGTIVSFADGGVLD